MSINNRKGTVTIESIIVFSTVFLIIILLIFSSIVLFEKARLYTLCSEFNLILRKSFNHNYTEQVSKIEVQAYEEKINQIVKRKTLLKQVKSEVVIQCKRSFLNYHVSIKISCKYKLPFTNLFKLMGKNNFFELEASYESNDLLNEEMIRNIDLLKWIVKEYKSI
jgi:hypothetical protein